MNNHIETIKTAERQLAAAHLTLDLDTIDQLLHPDYLILQPDGRFETKADVLASYRSGERHWNTAEVDQIDVRLYGSTALVTGRWQATGSTAADPSTTPPTLSLYGYTKTAAGKTSPTNPLKSVKSL